MNNQTRTLIVGKLVEIIKKDVSSMTIHTLVVLSDRDKKFGLTYFGELPENLEACKGTDINMLFDCYTVSRENNGNHYVSINAKKAYGLTKIFEDTYQG